MNGLATIGKLAGSVAHEIRTPLTVIRNGVTFLDYKHDSDNDVREVLAEMNRAVANSNHIITEMLDYVREPISAPCVFSARSVVSETLRQVPLPEDIHLLQDGLSGEIRVKANLDQITRTLTNLLQNALQAMPKGGELEIKAGENDGKVCIEVRDTGEGIPPENLERIFEPLFSTKVRGIGLGLAIARRYAQLSGGELSVESEPGNGSTFRLFLKPASGTPGA